MTTSRSIHSPVSESLEVEEDFIARPVGLVSDLPGEFTPPGVEAARPSKSTPPFVEKRVAALSLRLPSVEVWMGIFIISVTFSIIEVLLTFKIVSKT